MLVGLLHFASFLFRSISFRFAWLGCFACVGIMFIFLHIFSLCFVIICIHFFHFTLFLCFPLPFVLWRLFQVYLSCRFVLWYFIIGRGCVLAFHSVSFSCFLWYWTVYQVLVFSSRHFFMFFIFDVFLKLKQTPIANL